MTLSVINDIVGLRDWNMWQTDSDIIWNQLRCNQTNYYSLDILFFWDYEITQYSYVFVLYIVCIDGLIVIELQPFDRISQYGKYTQLIITPQDMTQHW